MRQRFQSHLTYANVMVTIVAFIVLGGMSYAATGGNFKLGQLNSAGAPTALTSSTDDKAGTLNVTNTSPTGAGPGIVAGSHGWAIAAAGNTTQGRAANGFVKAMALVEPVEHARDPIQQCFNSQLPPLQATAGNCGITYTRHLTGNYILDFGFKVSDRIVSITGRFGQNAGGLADEATIRTAQTPDTASDIVRVVSWNTLASQGRDADFFIVVY